MARGTIFITHYVHRKEIKEEHWYSYLKEGNKDLLRVYKQEEQIFEQEVSQGDAFEVIIKGNKTFVTPMTPPRKDWELVAWLLGYSKTERTSSYELYLELLETKRGKCEVPGYVESVLEGPNFEFAEYSNIDDENQEYRNLMCYVDECINKKEICHLIQYFIYPEQYVKKVLFERFGITDEEFKKAISVLY